MSAGPSAVLVTEGADSALVCLRDYLAAHASQDRAMAHVLEHGRSYRMTPDGPPLCEARMCFKNAATTVLADDRYIYVEGFAQGSPPYRYRHRHAWVADADGNAFDVTWNFTDFNLGTDHHEYIGVAVPIDLVRELAVRTGWFGVLDKPLYYELVDARRVESPAGS